MFSSMQRLGDFFCVQFTVESLQEEIHVKKMFYLCRLKINYYIIYYK